jgi:hypothetical protein
MRSGLKTLTAGKDRHSIKNRQPEPRGDDPVGK